MLRPWLDTENIDTEIFGLRLWPFLLDYVVAIQTMAVGNCGWHLDYGPSDFGWLWPVEVAVGSLEICFLYFFF